VPKNKVFAPELLNEFWAHVGIICEDFKKRFEGPAVMCTNEFIGMFPGKCKYYAFLTSRNI
jgi:hypothetical protein